MPRNMLTQVDHTLNDMGDHIALIRQGIPTLATREAAGGWFFMNTLVIVAGSVALGLALLMLTPLYVMDLFLYGLVSVFSPPKPGSPVEEFHEVPNARHAVNGAGFFAAPQPAHARAELYSPSMMGIYGVNCIDRSHHQH